MRPEDWKEEWKDMPEFVQDRVAVHHTLIVRFESDEDIAEFAAKIGQHVSRKTKSIWYPELQRSIFVTKRWVDES